MCNSQSQPDTWSPCQTIFFTELEKGPSTCRNMSSVKDVALYEHCRSIHNSWHTRQRRAMGHCRELARAVSRHEIIDPAGGWRQSYRAPRGIRRTIAGRHLLDSKDRLADAQLHFNRQPLDTAIDKLDNLAHSAAAEEFGARLFTRTWICQLCIFHMSFPFG